MFISSCLKFLFFGLMIHFPILKLTIYDKNTVWYLIHVLCNTCVVYLTFNDLKICIFNPDSCFDEELFSPDALAVTLGLHLYHIIVSFNTLTVIDWLHHLISNVLIVFLGINYVAIPLWNMGAFFMCGLPGGIDYLLLFLTKLKIINRETEKSYNVFLNNWIRAPGISYCASLLNIGYMQNKINTSGIIIYSTVFAIMFNAVYFAERVTLNYASKAKLNYS